MFSKDFKGIKYLGFDIQGRPKGVQARLCNEVVRESEGSPPSDKQEDLPKGWEEASQLLLNRGDAVVRAHLLPQKLGGPGVAKNLVVTCREVNNPELSTKFESIARKWVESGSTVDYEVIVEYDGNSPYPKSFKVRASRLDCQQALVGKPRCNEVKPEIKAQVDITDCKFAEKK